jgi:predicted nucleic acid-binding protein
MVFRREVVLLMDLKLSLEYRAVALRPEHLKASSLDRQEVMELIGALEAFAEPVAIGMRARPLSPDPDDDMILDLAIYGDAEALVTMNKKHFRAAGKRFGIEVLLRLSCSARCGKGSEMATETRRTATFPLRLMPSVKRGAETFSEKEGVSLNQFINVAVAEKLAHLEHEEWVRNRKPPTSELAVRALSLLDKVRNQPVEPGDELPERYRARRRKQEP